MIYSYEIIIRIIIKRLIIRNVETIEESLSINRTIIELNEIRIKILIRHRKYLFHRSSIFFQKYNNHAESDRIYRKQQKTRSEQKLKIRH